MCKPILCPKCGKWVTFTFCDGNGQHWVCKHCGCNSDSITYVVDTSTQEAKAKYEAWKKRNIRVGDEVIYNSRIKAVVLIPETKERYGTILTNDLETVVVSHDDLEKTGRHLDGIEELLKKMKEEEE